jgi:macrolide transport system ATP-binding/permease protein
MTLLARLRSRLKWVMERSRLEDQMEAEVRFHIDSYAEDLLQSGLTQEQAKRRAQIEFGGIESLKDAVRASLGLRWWDDFWSDVRIALRIMRRNPGFTLVAVVSLGIGVGINSSLFSFADALLLRPLPVFHPNEVVVVAGKSPSDPLGAVSYPDYTDFRDRSKSFDELVAFATDSFAFATRRGELPQMETGLLVSGNLFRAMGVEPELGRGFRPGEDEVPGRDAVVVLSHDFWEKQFGADNSVIGRTVQLDGIEFVVIGVSPERFTGMDPLLRPAFFVPLMMAPRLDSNPARNLLERRDDRDLDVKGRLKSGVTLVQAQAELATIARGLELTYPAANKNQSVTLMTELGARIARDPQDAGLIAMLMTMAAVVLLVACANLATLLLSRARTRTREIAIRLAVGAGRMRLVRQLLVESLVIALAGGAVSLLFASAGTAFLNRIRIPTTVPLVIAIKLDHRALLFGLAASLLSALFFGLAPALQASRIDLVSGLKSAEADTPVHSYFWGRKTLVVAQVALSLVLMVLATLLFRGFHSILAGGPGFRTDHLVMMSFDPGLVRYNEEQIQQFYKQLSDRVRSTPRVRSAALTQVAPLAPNQPTENIVPEGYQFPEEHESETVFTDIVDLEFFTTLGLPILRGRSFRKSDQQGTPLVAVVNEALTQHFWPNQDAVGKRFRLKDEKGAWVEIVGIAKNSKYVSLAKSSVPEVYFSLAQHPQVRMTLIAQAIGDATSLVAPFARDGT